MQDPKTDDEQQPDNESHEQKLKKSSGVHRARSGRDADEPPRFLRLPQVQDLTGLPRSTIYWYMGDGRFPKAFQISERSVAWLESEIMDWMQERIAARGGRVTQALRSVTAGSETQRRI